jgi:hypothetical protein
MIGQIDRRLSHRFFAGLHSPRLRRSYLASASALASAMRSALSNIGFGQARADARPGGAELRLGIVDVGTAAPVVAALGPAVHTF